MHNIDDHTEPPITPEEAMEMLDFFVRQLQITAPDISGGHSYRFRNGGYPMQFMVGRSRLLAVRAAVEKVKRDRAQREIGT